MNSTLLQRTTGIVSIVGLLAVSGAFTTIYSYFSDTPVSGCTNVPSGYGYGYEVTCPTSGYSTTGGTSSSFGGAGWSAGGSFSSNGTTTTTTTNGTTTKPTTIINTLDITDPYTCGKNINGTVTNSGAIVTIVFKRFNKAVYTFKVITDAKGNYVLPINYTDKSNANYVTPNTYVVEYSTIVNGVSASKQYRTKITNQCSAPSVTDGFVAPKSFPKTGA